MPRRSPLHWMPMLALACLTACERAVPDLLQDLRGDDPFVRKLAIVGLRGTSRDSADSDRAVNALLGASHHENDRLRPDIDAALQQIATRSPEVFVARLEQQLDQQAERIVKFLEAAGAVAIPALAESLGSSREFDRVTTAQTLGAVGGGDTLRDYAAGAREPTATAIAIAGLERAGETRRADLTALASRLLDSGAAAAIRTAARHSPTAAWTMLEQTAAGAPAEAAIVRGILDSMANAAPGAGVSALILGQVAARATPHMIDVLLDPDERESRSIAAMALGAGGAATLRRMFNCGVDATWIALAANRDVAIARATIEAVIRDGSTAERELARSVLARLR